MTGGSVHIVIANPYGYELFEPGARATRVYGGAEVQLYHLATTLAAMPDIRVSMVVERPRSGPLRDVVDGVTMRFVTAMPRLDRLRRYLPVPSPTYLNALVRCGGDVVVQRGGAVLTADAALAAAVSRVPFVFMAAHDWDCTRQHVTGRQRLAGEIYLWALRRAELVIAQTDDQAGFLRRWHDIDAPVLRSGLPAAVGLPDRPHPAEAPVLWVGRCVAWKRPEAFLALAQRLTHRQFVMVCPIYDGEEDLAERVRAHAEALPNLEFVSFVPFRETAALFGTAGMFVNTSTAEGFPNTFMQATSAGTPVASLSIDSDDLIQRHGIGVVGNGSISMLADRVEEMLGDRAMWQAASTASLNYFAANHELDSIAAILASILRQIAAAGRRAPT